MFENFYDYMGDWSSWLGHKMTYWESRYQSFPVGSCATCQNDRIWISGMTSGNVVLWATNQRPKLLWELIVEHCSRRILSKTSLFMFSHLLGLLGLAISVSNSTAPLPSTLVWTVVGTQITSPRLSSLKQGFRFWVLPCSQKMLSLLAHSLHFQ